MDKETKKDSWNKIVARFVDQVYSKFMKECLKDSKNFGFGSEEMFQLINRPIGNSLFPSVNNERLRLDKEFYYIYNVVEKRRNTNKLKKKDLSYFGYFFFRV